MTQDKTCKHEPHLIERTKYAESYKCVKCGIIRDAEYFNKGVKLHIDK